MDTEHFDPALQKLKTDDVEQAGTQLAHDLVWWPFPKKPLGKPTGSHGPAATRAGKSHGARSHGGRSKRRHSA